MPELPEVEVTRRGIAPYLNDATVQRVVLRHAGLRWPFPAGIDLLLRGKQVLATERRGKYLLIGFENGTLLLHLGMSGRLRFLSAADHVNGIAPEPGKHDHVDLVLDTGILRLTDARRFGAMLWHSVQDGHVHTHPLLAKLGLEPLEDGFSGQVLHRATRQRSAAIKQVLLAGDIVVGVGNIYASESLFKAGIHPALAASRISLAKYVLLAEKIRLTLSEAITLGGSTLRDFIGPNGAAGYFQQTYFVYDRTGLPCRVCSTPIRQIKQGQRSTFYCPHCQKK